MEPEMKKGLAIAAPIGVAMVVLAVVIYRALAHVVAPPHHDDIAAAKKILADECPSAADGGCPRVVSANEGTSCGGSCHEVTLEVEKADGGRETCTFMFDVDRGCGRDLPPEHHCGR